MAANNDNSNDDDSSEGVQIDETHFAGVDIPGANEGNDDEEESNALGWDVEDDGESDVFDGDAAALAREWVEKKYDVVTVAQDEDPEDDRVPNAHAAEGEWVIGYGDGGGVNAAVHVPSGPVEMNEPLQTRGQPVAVGDMLFDLQDERHGLGGIARNMADLWRAFDAFPATGRELIDQLKTPEEAWADARRMYDTATQSPDTPDKKDARSKVIKALEIEYEWMYVTDRSNEDYYDLRCWTPGDGWREDAFQVVEQRMSDELGTRSTKAETNHVIHHLANRNPVHSEQLDAGDDPRTLIPFQNGVLDLESVELDEDGRYVEGSAELLDHDPEYRFTTRVECEWNPDDAEFDVIDSFMTDIVGGTDLTPTSKETDIKTLWEFAGHSLFKRYNPQGFLMFIGEGGDGKTVWFNLVTEVLGEDNVAGATLDAITGDKFSGAEVVDRKANIAADIGGTVQTDISDLKWMTGNDRSYVRPMRKAPFYERNKATMLFGSNDPPAFTEKKRSLKRRLYPVRAPFEFHNNPDPDDPHQKQKVQESELMAELTTDASLAAVALRMVEGARRLQRNDEWTLGQELDEDERLEFYESEADAMADFTRACIEPDPDGAVALDDLEMGYDGYAVEHDHPSKPRNTIKGEIERSRDVQIKRSNPRSWTEDDSRPTVYKGIRFTEEAAKYLPEHAFWEQYDIENPYDTGDEDSISESVKPVVTLESGTGRTDDPIRVTVDSTRDDPAYGWDDQGVLRDDTDTIRYKIEEGDTLQEGATYEISKFITGEFEGARVVHIVPGMTDVVMVEDGSRDDDQEPAEDPDSDVSESNGESVERPVQVQDDGEVLAVFTRSEAEQILAEPGKSEAQVAGEIGRKPTDDTLKAIRVLQDDAEDDNGDTSQRDRVQSVTDVIESVEDAVEGAAVKEVLDRLEDNGFDPEKAEKEIEKLLQKGEVYEVGGGRVRTT